MAWMAYFCACTVAALLALRDAAFLRRLPVVGALVLVGNVLRNSVLVALEARPQGLDESLHQAIGLGALFSAMGWQVVAPVQQTIGLLADAASPVALFSIGAVLARSQMHTASGAHAAIPLRDYVPLAAIKLLLHPVLVLVIGISAIRLGVPLDKFALTVMVLVAALPSASNVSLLAEKFGANNGRIARVILVSTAAAFLSFSGAVALLVD